MFKKTSVMRLMGLALCAFSINGCATPSQAYWDAKVKDLCEKDGGVTVFERVEISRKDYPEIESTPLGYAILSVEDHAKQQDLFFIRSSEEYLNKSNPEVRRDEQLIIRKKDNKIMSKLVSYSRVGGDIPDGISHPSYYSCENFKRDVQIYSSTITVK